MNIIDNEIGNDGIIEFSKNMVYLDDLEILDISDNCIENLGVIEISQKMKYISNLKEFYIGCILNNIFR